MSNKLFYYALVVCFIASGAIAQASVLIAGVTA
jgi:hypothetical protein